MARTFVDRGGTFTDVVTIDERGVRIRKVPSDRAVVGELAHGELCFGTTVATNALLERRTVPTLLVVTEGFADLPWIGDQSRPALFDPDLSPLPPLCTRVVEVAGRIDREGNEIEPLQVPALDLAGIASVAVVLVNSPRNPAHERAVAALLPPDIPVTLGHRVSPELGYLARIETALLDAAVTPVLRAAMARDRIPPGARAMRSDGSLCPAEALRAPDAVLSGPAGGVLAVAAVARQAGFRRAVGLDMGGTSTDVCRVDADTLPRREGDTIVAGQRVRRPVLEVETIAAGGGSILRNDGVRLTVGPDSAGADPGPQCFGRGGPPTLTDAALRLGLVDPRAFDPPLDDTCITLPGDAGGFCAIAREATAAAVRRLASSRGIDVSDHALVAYGGAAGQHAAAVAERVGIGVVLFHPCAAVLCAWGQSLAREEEAAVRPIWRPLDEAGPAVAAAFAEMEAALPSWERTRSLDLRFAGTDHPIEVGEADAEATFRREHRTRYGFDRPDHRVEVVNARVRAVAPAEQAVPAPPWDIPTTRGPKVLHTSGTSIEVPEGWTARVHRGLLWLEHDGTRRLRESMRRTEAGVALWGNRFAAVATEAGETLRRLARSINIRERLDFSCAIFDGEGNLVANAPHVPVHLGAMGETVRDLLRRHPGCRDGTAWLTNDPAAGGSHLPDLTVVTPVVAGRRRWFVASRAHHVDVGGISPGSMPPRSTTLAEEGLVFRQVPLLRRGRLTLPDLGGCRAPDIVRADLEAQIAANAVAARLLRALGPAAETWMRHLRDAAAESIDVDALSGEASDYIDGIAIHVSMLHGCVDFSGTGGPHRGNLNAPPGVVRAALLYALRLLAGRDIPLNEGVLRPLRIVVPSPSLLSPPVGAAVVGGNVETSQRLVDLLLRAAGARASSMGTMNNLTLGGEGWSLYETIGGGQGASPRGPGLAGRQVHMTNTRATDVEVVEATWPLRVRRFALRKGSGGPGRHRGGDGLVREIEVLGPTTAGLLATRRDRGAPGLDGGGEGVPGKDRILRKGRWEDWAGESALLEAGDRVRIETPGGGGWGR